MTRGLPQQPRMRAVTRAAALLAVLGCVVLAPRPARAADDLHLAPGLSFTDDSSDAFPIRGRHLADATTGDGKATIVFFGASNCWNTNREAERLVSLYPKYKDRVRFVADSPKLQAFIARYREQGSTVPSFIVHEGALLAAPASAVKA